MFHNTSNLEVQSALLHLYKVHSVLYHIHATEHVGHAYSGLHKEMFYRSFTHVQQEGSCKPREMGRRRILHSGNFVTDAKACAL